MKDTFNIRYAKKSDIPEMTFLLSQLFEIEKDFCAFVDGVEYQNVKFGFIKAKQWR